MASRVTPRMILRAQARLQRQGIHRMMLELERSEPDLAEYALENLTAIFHRLLDIGATARQSRDLNRQIESVFLVCITSNRQARRL